MRPETLKLRHASESRQIGVYLTTNSLVQVRTSSQGATGFDRVRHYEIGEKNIELHHLDEAFTTEHWIVRIYKVKKPSNRE